MTSDRLQRCRPAAAGAATASSRRASARASWIHPCGSSPTLRRKRGLAMKRCLLLLFATAALSRHAPACGSPCASLQVASDYAFACTSSRRRTTTARFAFKRHAFFYQILPPASRIHASLCEFAAGHSGEAVGGFDSYSKAAAPVFRGASQLLPAVSSSASTRRRHRSSPGRSSPIPSSGSVLLLPWAGLCSPGSRARAGTAMDRYSLCPRRRALPGGAHLGTACQRAPVRPEEREAPLYSAFPGGGQLYVGHGGDAVYSALLVGAAACLP